MARSNLAHGVAARTAKCTYLGFRMHRLRPQRPSTPARAQLLLLIKSKVMRAGLLGVGLLFQLLSVPQRTLKAMGWPVLFGVER